MSSPLCSKENVKWSWQCTDVELHHVSLSHVNIIQSQLKIRFVLWIMDKTKHFVRLDLCSSNTLNAAAQITIVSKVDKTLSEINFMLFNASRNTLAHTAPASMCDCNQTLIRDRSQSHGRLFTPLQTLYRHFGFTIPSFDVPPTQHIQLPHVCCFSGKFHGCMVQPLQWCFPHCVIHWLIYYSMFMWM